MVLKKVTFFTFIVKLMFVATLTNAQTNVDSSKQNRIQFYSPIIYKPDSLQAPVFFNKISGNFYAKQLPFFCNKELQVQKAVGIPIKFRVGSVDYVDRLEGKNR